MNSTHRSILRDNFNVQLRKATYVALDAIVHPTSTKWLHDIAQSLPLPKNFKTSKIIGVRQEVEDQIFVYFYDTAVRRISITLNDDIEDGELSVAAAVVLASLQSAAPT